MRSARQIAATGSPVTSRALCATTDFFYDLLACRISTSICLRPRLALELLDPGLRRPQETGRHDILVGGAGLNAAGTPTWSVRESDATPIVQNGTMGDLSVTWCKDLGLWLMTYDS